MTSIFRRHRGKRIGQLLEPVSVALQARDVSFDWSRLAMH
jgi:hypothetical protein